MSTKLTGGRATAGFFASQKPGFGTGGVPFTSASTAVILTTFKFPTGAVVYDFAVKITSVAATSGDISIGITTGASSGGVGNAYVNQLPIGAVGSYVLNASTSAAVLAFNYGSYLIASTSAAVTVLKKHVVGSTDTYRYLNYTIDTTAAISGSIYPFYYELT